MSILGGLVLIVSILAILSFLDFIGLFDDHE